MASSSGRDKDPKESQQPYENPFIRFKQFADAQIGSILSSIIGLPSAFDKSSGHAQWADFNNELKRRDELQARQKALRDSESAKVSDTANEDEAQIPIKKSRDWVPSSTSPTGTSTTRQMDDEGEREWNDEEASAKDWPLYSQITRSLFSHLWHSSEDDGSWDLQHANDVFEGIFHPLEPVNAADLPAGWERRITPEVKTYYVDHNTRTTTWNPASAYRFLLRPDQKSFDTLKMLQYMVYNNLNKTAKIRGTIGRDSNQDSHDYYMHLMLAEQQRKRRLFQASQEQRGMAGNLVDGSATYGQTSLLPYLLFSPYSPLKLSERRHADYADPDNFPYEDAFEDLMLLHHGLPMASEPKDYSSARLSFPRDEFSRAKNCMSWIYALGSRGILSHVGMHATTQIYPAAISNEIARTMVKDVSFETPSSEANTEQEMYDRFLRSASSSTSIGVFDALFKDAEKFVKERLTSTESQRENTTLEKENNIDGNTKSPVPLSQTSLDSERVVSTYTTSNHVKHEDGTVETTLAIRKVFADGRTTVTETSHTELPRNEDEWEEMSPDTKQPEPSAKKAESTKRGWFWN